MNYQIEIARNGEQTLKVKGRYIYSKYYPKSEAINWIKREVDKEATNYLLIGLGLGYHLEGLVHEVPSKVIQVLQICSEDNHYEVEVTEGVKVISNLKDLMINESTQILIPQVWLQVIEASNPLLDFLKDIKMKQVSYKRFASKMVDNFHFNTLKSIETLNQYKTSFQMNELACLVSSGPSLNETVHWLKNIKDNAYILCVGSALKVLLKEDIQPNAVIITDCQDNIAQQLENTNYNGVLFYMATANASTVSNYLGKKVCLFQKGYKPSEKLANELDAPLLITGGSVSTTAYSVLHYLGFKKVVLFGQDLTVSKEATHADNSTSNRYLYNQERFIKVHSNLGDEVNTLPNLYSYKQWFDKMVVHHKMETYTTSSNGCKINKVKYLDETGLTEM